MQLHDLEQRVCDVAAEHLGIPRAEVRPASRIIDDLKCDSLDLVELIMEMEAEFSVTIPNTPPNPVYKAVFARSQFRLRDLAELIYLQLGSGKPDRSQLLKQMAASPAPEVVPFSQLSGRWQRDSNGAPTILFEEISKHAGDKAYRRLSDGMRCRLLPAAEVEIGSNDSDSLLDEQPLHSVELSAFLIDAEPVSTTAFCRFLNSIESSPEMLHDWFELDADDDRQQHMPIRLYDAAWEPVAGLEQLPMILVSWYGANAYSLWANDSAWHDYHTAEGYLPSEAQWEYAARGAVSRPYPWIDSLSSPLPMNYARHVPAATYDTSPLPLSAVNVCQGMSPFELHHMAGNVWQWCRDWYAADFYRTGAATETNSVNRSATGLRSERGGSWVGPANLCRSSHRRARAPLAKGRCLGFRCISSVASLPIGNNGQDAEQRG